MSPLEVVLVAVASQDYALAILVTLVIGVGATASLTKRMMPSQFHLR